MGEKPLEWSRIIFILLAILTLTPFISPPIALLLGLVFAQVGKHPFQAQNKKITGNLLKFSVVGLGFGMNLQEALKVGKDGFLYTVITIFGTLLIGILLSKLMKTERVTSYLISGGTAICGGSAIAALGPVVKADEKQMSVALGTVFILNSVALFIFPVVGQYFELSQHDFGIWSAIAIHDTSSVVGAAAKYGDTALEVATTVKLARALWIIPLVLLTSMMFKSKDAKISIPYFIGFFILAIIANTYLPFVETISPYIVTASKAGLTLTLFLIGSGLSRTLLKSVGMKQLILGITLWIIISVSSLTVILMF